MARKSFVLRGDICYSQDKNTLITKKDSYLVCLDGVSCGVYKEIPPEYKEFTLYDYSEKLILPGLVDLHVHAPQYYYRGLGMDLELLDWLNTYTFPHEAKYKDVVYAQKNYQKFVEDIRKGPNTRSVCFATLHVESTIALMNLLEHSGLVSYVGKVNMDRNSIAELEEESAKKSAEDTIVWLEKVKNRYENTYPILTPRFIPSCSDALMEELGDIQERYKVPIQSHLSENKGEIQWVKELCPNSKNYTHAYEMFNMIGKPDRPAIMAHCIWLDEEQEKLLKDKGVYIAHCPNSNMNLASGIAPIRRYLEEGQCIGLGSDVAGGIHLSIFKAMSDAIQVSKLYWRLVDKNSSPITVEEAFYMGTLGGGGFFGKVGSFEKGYEMDAIVIEDAEYLEKTEFNLHQRLEKAIYLSENRHVIHKFVRGNKLF